MLWSQRVAAPPGVSGCFFFFLPRFELFASFVLLEGEYPVLAIFVVGLHLIEFFYLIVAVLFEVLGGLPNDVHLKQDIIEFARV